MIHGCRHSACGFVAMTTCLSDNHADLAIEHLSGRRYDDVLGIPMRIYWMSPPSTTLYVSLRSGRHRSHHPWTSAM